MYLTMEKLNTRKKFLEGVKDLLAVEVLAREGYLANSILVLFRVTKLIIKAKIIIAEPLI